MSEAYSPDVAAVLELMTAPAFLLRENRILFRNRAAAALVRSPEQASELLTPESLALVRSRGDHSLLEVTAVLDGRPCGAVLRQLPDCDVLIVHPEPAGAAADPALLARAAQIIRRDIAALHSTAAAALPLLEEARDGQARGLAGRMNRSICQLLRLAANLAEAGRYAAGEVTSQFAPVNLCDHLEVLCRRVAALTEAVQMTLTYSCPVQPVVAAADWPKLERAVLNLLSNALRSTAPGGCLRLTLEDPGATVHIVVEDDGAGMPPEQVAGFAGQPLHRGPAGAPQPGMGLGLTLVRRIAALHGGTVLIDSRPEQGTAVTMTLARRQAGPQQEVLHSPARAYRYTGSISPELLELSDVLPDAVYGPDSLG